MPGAPVPLGPFTGGMANVAEQATIDDDQVALLENYELDLDGSLVSRPAIVSEQTTGIVTGDIQPLGYYVSSAGLTYLVAAVDTITRIYELDGKVWTTIWTERASSFVQYDNKIVLSSETVAGGYWEAGSFTSTPTMPLATQIVFYQERFWAFGVRGTANATTVWFSNLTVISPPSSIFDWVTASNFFTVSKGDGEWITGLLADTSALLIFRNQSTYQFTYPTSPVTGTLRPLSKTIGAENQWAIVAYENYYVVLCAGFLYQFINYRFYSLNAKKINFERAALSGALMFDVRVSIFGRRVIVWFFGALYVYNITTSTWSKWVSPTTSAGHFLSVPPSSVSGESRVALAISGEDDNAKQILWRVEEDVLSTGSGETMQCVLRTKAYSLDESAQYKRLLYWAIEHRSASGLEAIAHPVAVPITGATWNDMEAYNWGDFGSWNNPLLQITDYTDTVTYPTLAPIMSTVKMIAAFRFIRVYFEVFQTCDGTTATSPSRIYSITPYMKIHAGLSKKVS